MLPLLLKSVRVTRQEEARLGSWGEDLPHPIVGLEGVELDTLQYNTIQSNQARQFAQSSIFDPCQPISPATMQKFVLLVLVILAIFGNALAVGLRPCLIPSRGIGHRDA